MMRTYHSDSAGLGQQDPALAGCNKIASGEFVPTRAEIILRIRHYRRCLRCWEGEVRNDLAKAQEIRSKVRYVNGKPQFPEHTVDALKATCQLMGLPQMNAEQEKEARAICDEIVTLEQTVTGNDVPLEINSGT